MVRIKSALSNNSLPMGWDLWEEISIPLSSITLIAFWLAGSWVKTAVPAETTSIPFMGFFASFNRFLKIPSAILLRQVLPVHTNNIFFMVVLPPLLLLNMNHPMPCGFGHTIHN